MSNHDRFFDSPCFSNSLWEVPPEAINTGDWADAWPADTAASAPAFEDALELPGGGAAPASEISSAEPLYGEIKLIDKPHGERLQGDAIILGAAVSCNDHRGDLCVSRILADLQAGADTAAAVQNECSANSADAISANGRASADSTTMAAKTGLLPLALAAYSYGNFRRSLSDSDSPRHLQLHQVSHHDGITAGYGGFREENDTKNNLYGFLEGNDTTNHSFDAGDSTLAFQPATTSLQFHGASFGALRAGHVANLGGLDPATTHHCQWHRTPESEIPLTGGEISQPPATAARLGVESESPRLWRDSVRQAANAAGAAACGNAPSNADAGAAIPACAVGIGGRGSPVGNDGAGDDGGSGLTLTGLLKQMKRRRTNASASGNMIDGDRPASTTDMAQDPEALCQVVSFRDTASENSSSGSSSTAADEEGGASSNSGMENGDRASSPLSGIAQALSDAALDEPESPAFPEAVTRAVTVPNPALTVTADMRARVVFAAETAVTLVPAMPAVSEGPTSPESIRRKAVLAALLQSSLARRRVDRSAILHIEQPTDIQDPYW
ncbi:unnamed protein product [Closterium sp. NIES-64]|nr:unnamed protein product [Closterium sp. NIES-64]